MEELYNYNIKLTNIHKKTNEIEAELKSKQLKLTDKEAQI